jgi:hypothetical protein
MIDSLNVKWLIYKQLINKLKVDTTSSVPQYKCFDHITKLSNVINVVWKRKIIS